MRRPPHGGWPRVHASMSRAFVTVAAYVVCGCGVGRQLGARAIARLRERSLPLTVIELRGLAWA